MSDAPERIWVDDERPLGGICHVYSELDVNARKWVIEYVRADIVDALVAEKVREALTEAHRRAGRLRGRDVPKRDAEDAGEAYDLAIDEAQAVISALRDQKEPKG